MQPRRGRNDISILPYDHLHSIPFFSWCYSDDSCGKLGRVRGVCTNVFIVLLPIFWDGGDGGHHVRLPRVYFFCHSGWSPNSQANTKLTKKNEKNENKEEKKKEERKMHWYTLLVLLWALIVRMYVLYLLCYQLHAMIVRVQPVLPRPSKNENEIIHFFY